MFVYSGSKRVAQVEHDRSIREWWNTLDQIALSSDQMLVLADEMMYTSSVDESLEKRRRRWFAFVILNALSSSYLGAKLGLTRSSVETVEIVRHHLRKLLVQDDIFKLSQEGYEPDFATLCREVRKEVVDTSRSQSV